VFYSGAFASGGNGSKRNLWRKLFLEEMRMFWLSLTDSFWSFGGLVVMLVQIGCVVHVLRTGRPYWWIWIIFGFPVIGMAAYLFFEVRPSLGRGKLNLQAIIWRLKSSAERIHIRQEQLDDASTIKNRLHLADELHLAAQYDRECAVVRDGLRGPFADDANLLLRLAEAQLSAGRAGEAAQLLDRIVPERSSDFLLRLKLLRARVFGELGQAKDSETVFRELVAANKSEAPRYYYAEFLLRQGRPGQAIPILRDILHQYRRGTPVWRFKEKPWYYAAKQLLKSPPAATAKTIEPVLVGHARRA
jgi:hypothetical protein